MYMTEKCIFFPVQLFNALFSSLILTVSIIAFNMVKAIAA